MYNDFNLKVRGADFDAAELYAQRMILRADIMAAAVDHVQAAYGEKYDRVIDIDDEKKPRINFIGLQAKRKNIWHLHSIDLLKKIISFWN